MKKHLTLALTLFTLWSAQTRAENSNPGAWQNMQMLTQPGGPQDPNSYGDLLESIGQRLTFTYYLAFMGPSLGKNKEITYNTVESQYTPLQLYHGFNARFQITPDWAVGATLAGFQYITGPVTYYRGPFRYQFDNNKGLYNARAYVSVPQLNLDFAKFFHTFAVEFPTTPVSTREEELNYGLVAQQTIAFQLPPSNWTAGWQNAVTRYYYKQNTKPFYFKDGSKGIPTRMQTLLVSTGPYVNYSINLQWQIATLMSFDWDQRGDDQTGTTEFNENMTDRARVTLNRFFQNSALFHVGVYIQSATKANIDHTIVGSDLSLRF